MLHPSSSSYSGSLSLLLRHGDWKGNSISVISAEKWWCCCRLIRWVVGHGPHVCNTTQGSPTHKKRPLKSQSTVKRQFIHWFHLYTSTCFRFLMWYSPVHPLFVNSSQTFWISVKILFKNSELVGVILKKIYIYCALPNNIWFIKVSTGCHPKYDNILHLAHIWAAADWSNAQLGGEIFDGIIVQADLSCFLQIGVASVRS